MLTVMMKSDNVDRKSGPCRDWYVEGTPLVVCRCENRVPGRNLGDSDYLQMIGPSTIDPNIRTYYRIQAHCFIYKCYSISELRYVFIGLRNSPKLHASPCDQLI